MISDSLKNTENFYLKARSLAPHQNMGLESLVTQGFDSEQIWEQMVLFNVPMMKFLEKDFQEFLKGGDDYGGDKESDEASSSESMLQGSDEELEELQSSLEDVDQDELDQQIDEDEEQIQEEDDQDIREFSSDDQTSKPRRNIPTEVDDEFFSLREMESFADRAEAWDQIQQSRENNDDETQHEFDLGLGFLSRDPDADIDSEEEDGDDDGMRDIMYEDFFGPRPTERAVEREPAKISKRKREMEEMDPEEDYYNDPEPEESILNENTVQAETEQEAEDDSSDETEFVQEPSSEKHPINLFEEQEESKVTLSTFEKQQEKLSSKIASLESESIAPKPWQVMGEASAKSRPANALLDESLVVEYASKPVPVITPDTTASLEDKIKRRISEEAFDDPIRKIATQATVRKTRVQISDEKSSVSLDKIYEDEYMAANGKKEEEKKPASHFEIERLYEKLCGNLDALCNFHYTPTKIESTDTVVVASAPAISVEDVIPVATSNATLVAPSEVYSGGITEGLGEKKTGRKRRKKNRPAKTKEVDDGSNRAALKSLARQGNVVIIGDGKNKDSKSKASFIKAGDRVDENKSKRKSMAQLRL